MTLGKCPICKEGELELLDTRAENKYYCPACDKRYTEEELLG